jgi:hypothetical protein
MCQVTGTDLYEAQQQQNRTLYFNFALKHMIPIHGAWSCVWRMLRSCENLSGKLALFRRRLSPLSLVLKYLFLFYTRAWNCDESARWIHSLVSSSSIQKQCAVSGTSTRRLVRPDRRRRRDMLFQTVHPARATGDKTPPTSFSLE